MGLGSGAVALSETSDAGFGDDDHSQPMMSIIRDEDLGRNLDVIA